MNVKYWKTLFYSLLLLMPMWTGAQPEYTMGNNLVRDCEGILTDSENGPDEGQYDHNEDYIFTICVDQANEILLAFEFFATEDRYDVLTVYDGPDINSPVIATLSGIVQPPPVLVATSGCVTLHFVSDDNIVANGWRLRWMVEIDEPEIPDLELDGTILCPLQNAGFRFSLPIDCDLFDVANFNLIGPGSPVITGVNVLDCDSTGMASRFELVFADSLRQQGTYRLEFTGQIQDVCGEWHDVDADIIFTLSDCPIRAVITVIDTGCIGDCGRLRAEVIGDAPDNYIFQWSHTADINQEVEICSDDTVSVSVTIVNINTNRSTVAQVLYTPHALPVFLNSLNRDTFCAGNGDHIYQVSKPGGSFYSRIIPDNQRTTGRYQFWRWSNVNGLNQDIVTYVDPQGCEVRDTLYVYPINAGSIQAACLGSATFQMNGGTPTGGYWEGPHVDPDGTFDPTTSGSFVVTYVAPNGCRRNKRVNVFDSIVMPDIDTLCSSRRIDLRDWTQPYGGRWSGPGITNVVLGRLEGWRPASNQTYRYYYDVNGCRDSIDIYIQQLYSGPDIDVCTSTDTLFLNYTGNWTGPGIYLPAINAFDISGLGEGQYTYTLESDGCTDEFRLRIIQPYLTVKANLEFCMDDAWYNVLDYVDRFPDYGSFDAATLLDSNSTWYFNPMMLGPGTHPIVFNAVGCTDTFWLNVEGPADIPDYQFCEFDRPTELEADPAGGVWSGTGILDGTTGLFDPQVPGLGFHQIEYRSPRGCLTIDTIEIFEFEEVSINGVSQQYCFSDTVIQVDVQPPGGTLEINGMASNGMFNPSVLGTGTHEIYYTRGSGECQSDERIFFSVLPPIDGQAMASNDSICLGDPTVVEISATGGSGILSATWEGNLGFGNSHIIRPDTSGWYLVRVEDGCSDPFFDSVFVYVHPEFEVQLDEGPEVCYEDSTYVRIIPPNQTEYEAIFDNGDIVNDFLIRGQPGIYNVRVNELFSGCFQELEIELRGARPLRANFSLQPNQPCIDIIDNEVDVIDLSVGYSDGWVDFGDGSDTVSILTGPLTHIYEDTGSYTITMVVENELGCTDTISKVLCVRNKVQFFFPNIFTPNGDGENDEYGIYIYGAADLEWTIYNRYGGVVFKSNSPDDTWDGTFDGKKLDPAVFALRVSFKDAERGWPYLITRSITLVK